MCSEASLHVSAPPQPTRQPHAASSVHSLGIGLIQCPKLLEILFSDIFDIRHHFLVYFGDGGVSKDIEAEDELQAMALSVISVGVGTLTIVGGKTLGTQGIMEGIFHIMDLLGHETAHKWAMPVIGAFTIGLTAYLILELPNPILWAMDHWASHTGITHPSC